MSFDYRNGKNEMTVHQTNMEPWKVTVVDTSYNTMTGGRIKRIQKYVGNEPFLMTYGDGVCDVEIDKLVEFHKSHGKLATLTAVKMVQDIAKWEFAINGALMRKQILCDNSVTDLNFEDFTDEYDSRLFLLNCKKVAFCRGRLLISL